MLTRIKMLSDKEQRDEFLSILVAVGFVITCAGFWYVGWVQPHDEVRGAVRDCMLSHGGEMNRQLYDDCLVEVRKELAHE